MLPKNKSEPPELNAQVERPQCRQTDNIHHGGLYRQCMCHVSIESGRVEFAKGKERSMSDFELLKSLYYLI